MTDSDSTRTPPCIAIVGGGVSGLAAAHETLRLHPTAKLDLYEAGDRLGGALHTLRADDFLIEQGADSFITKRPAALELCRALGLEDRLISTNLEHRRALIVNRGRLVPVPAGFVLMRANNLRAVLKSPILTLRGKLRLLREPLVPRASDADDSTRDESVASFATRRLGREAYERLVQPLMAGIYVADATKLSLAATMPDFLEAERQHGSLYASIQAASKTQPTDSAASGARYGAFLTLPGGMGELIAALRDALPEDSIHMKAPVTAIRKEPVGWQLSVAGQPAEQRYDALILATPSYQAAKLLEPIDSKLCELVSQIEYASSVVVSCAYKKANIARPLDGFGFVVPSIEGRSLIAGSFSSVKFPGRAPDDSAVIRCFLGGVLQPKKIELEDAELLSIVKRELAELLGVSGEPLQVDIARWRRAMPQYHVGHLNLIERIESQTETHPGLALAGNAYRGVGVPHCAAYAKAAVQRATAQFVT